MNILFLIPHFPYPPHSGGTLRNFGMIKGLADAGYHITLMTFNETGQDLTGTPLDTLCDVVISVPAPARPTWTRLLELVQGHTDMARRFWSQAFQAQLRDLLGSQHFDVIHMDIEMAGYLPLIQEKGGDARLVYDALNAEYELQSRIAGQDARTLSRLPVALYSWIQSRRLRQVEGKLCEAVDHVFACSGVDADLLRDLDHTTTVSVVPNAITVSNYNPADFQRLDLKHPSLVFTGKMDFRPNVDAAMWLANDILPRIREKVPGTHLYIVGQQPHARLDSLRDREDITITGAVDQIQPYVMSTDVYVAPLRMGSGTRFKLLEAMSMNAPVVSTSIGAEGLEVTSGHHLLLADTVVEFAQQVVRLLKDESLRGQMVKNGRVLVESNYDWSVIVPRIEAGYRPPTLITDERAQP